MCFSSPNCTSLVVSPFPSNFFHGWRIVDTVTPVQRAFWGSDLNWMSAVKASQEAVGGWCHSWRLCRRNTESHLPLPGAYKTALPLSSALIWIRWGGFFLKAAADKAPVCCDFPSLDGRGQTMHVLLREIQDLRKRPPPRWTKAAALNQHCNFSHNHLFLRQICSPQTAFLNSFYLRFRASQLKLVRRGWIAERSIYLNRLPQQGGTRRHPSVVL